MEAIYCFSVTTNFVFRLVELLWGHTTMIASHTTRGSSLSLCFTQRIRVLSSFTMGEFEASSGARTEAASAAWPAVVRAHDQVEF